jgi:hypothetical protein
MTAGGNTGRVPGWPAAHNQHVLRLTMSGKAEIAKLKKQRTADELENLFTQFDEQVHVVEEKITIIKKNIKDFEVKKNPEEHPVEDEGANRPEDKINPA